MYGIQGFSNKAFSFLADLSEENKTLKEQMENLEEQNENLKEEDKNFKGTAILCHCQQPIHVLSLEKKGNKS